MNVMFCSYKESMYIVLESEQIEMIFYVNDYKILKGVFKSCVVGKEKVIERNMVWVELGCGDVMVKFIV